MTADERLGLINVKIKRAEKHFADLNEMVTAFLASQPYGVAAKHESQTRKLVYYVARVEPVPSEICGIVGDLMHNLRSALDHLAQQLVLVNGVNPTVDTGFPIDATAANYIANKIRKI